MSEISPEAPPAEAVVTPPEAPPSAPAEPAAEAPSSSPETPPAVVEDTGEQAGVGEIDWSEMQQSIESTGELPQVPADITEEPPPPAPAAALEPAASPQAEVVPVVPAPETPPVAY